MDKKTIIDKLWLRFFRIPIVKKYWEKNFKSISSREIPWTKLNKRLSECKISLLTTGGIILKTDKEFDLNDPNGDSTYRRIPDKISKQDLKISHKYYDHSDADLDPNLIFPIDILHELQEEGIVGPSSPYHFSFMGHIKEPHLTTLIQQSAVNVAKEIREQKIDIVLLVPA